MKNVVAYCRVSTEAQNGDDRFGLESQRQQITEFCAKNDLNILKWYEDVVSGASDHRPSFDELLLDTFNPPIEAVVVAKADRIARDINLYYAYKFELTKKNVELISASEDWSAQDKLTGMILENFLAMAAMLEKENIRRRTMGGRRIKSQGGGYAGGKAPFGYIAKERQLFVNADEAKAVKRIYELRRGGATLLGIVEVMKAEGFTGRNGNDMAYATIYGILENEKTYMGYYRYGKTDVWVRGQHEPILKEEN